MALRMRTDLACEAPELSASGMVPGVDVHREKIDGLELYSVEIKNKDGAAVLGKPVGHYYTLELARQLSPGLEEFTRSVSALSKLLSRCMGGLPRGHILIAALGNPDITPDAIGPLAASSLLVTKHLKERNIPGFENFSSTALCRTGVLGTTGIESAKQIRSICRELQPELVIAVDALAGTEVNRLCRSVQICDSGISPGSGVGNDREELSFASLGVPVVAVGVPTVIDAASLCPEEGLESLFVTPRDIDSLVRSASRLVAYAINMCLHPGLSIEDMEMLIG